uniref:Uncharacterized protein n=1 Tax=Polysiphonia urceolata TaxID=173545 RepID=A0A1Z1MC43_POLUR|nr:hypothetical protein [Polysiphonia stricta]ARW63550.1 hypothetical protein [Polysiphonia stricta]
MKKTLFDLIRSLDLYFFILALIFIFYSIVRDYI